MRVMWVFAWLLAYEGAWLAGMLVAWSLGWGGGQSASQETFGTGDPLSSALSAWINSEVSFLLGGVLVLIHPVLGTIPALATSVEDGELLTSWLGGAAPFIA